MLNIIITTSQATPELLKKISESEHHSDFSILLDLVESADLSMNYVGIGKSFVQVGCPQGWGYIKSVWSNPT